MRCASETAWRASAASCPRPRNLSSVVVERLNAERDPVDAGRAKVLESRRLGRGRIGFEGDLRIRREGPPRRRPVDDGGCGLGRHQRGCAPTEEDAGNCRNRQQRREMVELAQQRIPPPGLIHALTDMAVEVAVGALGEAERPVDVKGERRIRQRFEEGWVQRSPVTAESAGRLPAIARRPAPDG